MWTPKRVLILVGGFVFFTSLYTVYAYFLDGINGLPPLPQEYVQSDDSYIRPKTDETSETIRRLEMAFRPGAEEMRRPIQLWLRDKGIALAAGQFDIEPDGRVKLSPFSVALFPKTKGEGFPEINIIQSENCFLTLDEPVSNLSQLPNRKVTAVELRGQGGVTLINNRHTPEKNDDLSVFITGKPLFYDDRRNVIWTDGYVKLIDTQSQPEPTTITAKGMELKLSKDVASNRPKPATPPPATAKKENGVGGVESIKLHSNVDMFLWIDSNSTFLGESKEVAKAPTSVPIPKTKDVAERSKVAIKTNGPFVYDLTKEIATFDIPAAIANKESVSPEDVLVTRVHKFGTSVKNDQLSCDHLKLTFRRKNESASGPRDSRNGDKEIDSAYATTHSGKDVVLSLDTQQLEAFGNELFYFADNGKQGPQTILKGNPMHAVKEDGSKITARELHLSSLGKNKTGQQVFAKGPGQIDMMDKGKAQNEYPIHIKWQDTLVSFKEREGDQTFDHLTLVGDAAFIDEEHNQRLEGNRLQVWLHDQQTVGNSPMGASSSKQKLHKVLAEEKVKAVTPEMIVRRTNRLYIIFLADVGAEDRLPAPVVQATPASVTSNRADPTPAVATALPAGPATTAPAPQLAIVNPEPAKKQNKPIEMEGDDIVLYITTQGTKNQLQEMNAKDNVYVMQEGDKVGEKRVEIIGQLLKLTHHSLGDKLEVYGEKTKLAFLELGEMKLWGPKIIIDQKDNIAAVEGQGAMNMPSNANFDGTKSTKADTRLTIHWNKNMIFRGKDADFYGGVQASQDSSMLRCQDLSITLDRFVSLKDGQKGGGQGAKVDRLIASLQVFATDEKRENGKLVQANIIQGTSMTMDNQDGPVQVQGPAVVRNLAYSAPDMGLAPGATKNQAKDAELKMTRIECSGWAQFKNKANGKSAQFLDNVHVYHFPALSFDAVMNADNPPLGAFYMNCSKLSLESRLIDGKQTQMMIAEKNVTFRTQEYFGTADIVKFDESQDNIILEATGNNVVRLSKRVAQGQPEDTTTGRRFLYNRKTGKLHGGEIKNLRGSRLESPQLRPRIETCELRLEVTGLDIFEKNPGSFLSRRFHLAKILS